MPKGERNAEKEYCRNGHAYDEENTMVCARETARGWARGCRKCSRERYRRRLLNPTFREAEAARKRGERMARLNRASAALEPPPIRSLACALAEPAPEGALRPIRGVSATAGAGDLDVPFLPRLVRL